LSDSPSLSNVPKVNLPIKFGRSSDPGRSTLDVTSTDRQILEMPSSDG
jgi:hypothetical protein